MRRKGGEEPQHPRIAVRMVTRLAELATLTEPKRMRVEARRPEETLTALSFTASATGA